MALKKMFEKSAEAAKELQDNLVEAALNRSGDKYIITQVILKEQMLGVGSKNLGQLQSVINKQCELGYVLHTCSITKLGSEGIGGGDRLQATCIFEKI